MNMKIDVKFNFSFKLVLNIILKEKKDIQKKKESKKKEKINAFFLQQIILSYSDCIFLFSFLSCPLNSNRARVELSIKLLMGFYSRMSIFCKLKSIWYATEIFTYNSCN